MGGNLAILSVAAIALGLAGCGKKASNLEPDGGALAGANAAMAQGNGANAAAAVMPARPMATQDFVDALASGDAFGIAESRLALAKGDNAEVKAFATRMAAAHAESSAKVEKVAAAAIPAIIPDSALTPEQRSRLDALGALSGAAFDRQYAADQVAAHARTLEALHAYAVGGSVAALKTVAAQLSPVVQEHLDRAKKLPQ